MSGNEIHSNLKFGSKLAYLIWYEYLKYWGHIQKSYLWFFWIDYFRLMYKTVLVRYSYGAQEQSTSLNERYCLTELQLVCTTARLGKGSWLITFSHPNSLEPDTQGWNNGIKMGDHKSSKSWTSRFTIFVTKLHIASYPKDHNVTFLYFPSNSCVPATADV